MESKPVVNKEVKRLYSIPGTVPNPINMPAHCYFKDRCERQRGACGGQYPGEVKLSDTHSVSCYLFHKGEEAQK
jgi:peptide/nickel transport system ATP-binding protein